MHAAQPLNRCLGEAQFMARVQGSLRPLGAQGWRAGPELEPDEHDTDDAGVAELSDKDMQLLDDIALCRRGFQTKMSRMSGGIAFDVESMFERLDSLGTHYHGADGVITEPDFVEFVVKLNLHSKVLNHGSKKIGSRPLIERGRADLERIRSVFCRISNGDGELGPKEFDAFINESQVRPAWSCYYSAKETRNVIRSTSPSLGSTGRRYVPFQSTTLRDTISDSEQFRALLAKLSTFGESAFEGLSHSPPHAPALILSPAVAQRRRVDTTPWPQSRRFALGSGKDHGLDQETLRGGGGEESEIFFESGTTKFEKTGVLYHIATNGGTTAWQNPHTSGRVSVQWSR